MEIDVTSFNRATIDLNIYDYDGMVEHTIGVEPFRPAVVRTLTTEDVYTDDAFPPDDGPGLARVKLLRDGDAVRLGILFKGTDWERHSGLLGLTQKTTHRYCELRITLFESKELDELPGEIFGISEHDEVPDEDGMDDYLDDDAIELE